MIRQNCNWLLEMWISILLEILRCVARKRHEVKFTIFSKNVHVRGTGRELLGATSVFSKSRLGFLIENVNALFPKLLTPNVLFSQTVFLVKYKTTDNGCHFSSSFAAIYYNQLSAGYCICLLKSE